MEMLARLHRGSISLVGVCAAYGSVRRCIAVVFLLMDISLVFPAFASVTIYENVFEGGMFELGYYYDYSYGNIALGAVGFECHAYGPYGSLSLSFAVTCDDTDGDEQTTTLTAIDVPWFGPIVELDTYEPDDTCNPDTRAAWIVLPKRTYVSVSNTVYRSSVFRDKDTGRNIPEKPYTYTGQFYDTKTLYLCFGHPNGTTIGWVKIGVCNGQVWLEGSCIATGVTSLRAGTTTYTVTPETLLEGGIRQLDIFVDASAPVNGTGLSWESPFKSIQEAVDAVRLDGTTVHVKPGVYGTVTVNNEKFTKNNLSYTFSVQSTDGPEKTIIDGGGVVEVGTGAFASSTRGCFWYGDNPVPLYDSIKGFTLRNSIYGVYYGNVEDCIVSNCAWGAMFCSAHNCLIADIKHIGVGGGSLINCTVTRNNNGITTAKAANSIIWGNVKDNFYDSSFRDATNCCIPVVPTVGKYDLVLVGPGNIMKDPRFVDPDAGDFRLRPDSPCIDAGLSGYASGATDLAGGARIRGVGIDIGCFEFVPTVSDTNVTHGVTVSPEWLERYYGLDRTSSPDAAYQVAALAETANPRDGTAAGGKLAAWESYLWDLDPADSNQIAHAEIAVVGGMPHVNIVPASSNRVYTLLGKASLGAKDWARSKDFSDAAFLETNRFFKVSVDLE